MKNQVLYKYLQIIVLPSIILYGNPNNRDSSPVRYPHDVNIPFDLNSIVGKVASQRLNRYSSDDAILFDTNATYIRQPEMQWGTSIACDGTDYLAVWVDTRHGNDDIYGARITASGEILDPAGFPIAKDIETHQLAPVTCFGDSLYLVVWGDNNLSATRVDRFGTVLDTVPITIAVAPYDEGCHTLAFGDSLFYVVWGYGGIYGARVTQGGEVLDPGGILLSARGHDPAIASNGNNFLVVWSDYNMVTNHDIHGRRVDQNLTVLDTADIIIQDKNGPQEASSVASNGDDFLVVWQDNPTGTPWYDYDIRGARISSAGVLIDTVDIAISDTSELVRLPVVVFDDFNYFVVWENISDYNVYGARVTTSGVVLDTASINISSEPWDHYVGSVAVDSAHCFVVWVDTRYHVNDRDVCGKRVNRLGAVIDTSSIVISTAAYDQHMSSVAFDGTNYFVVWADRRMESELDIYGMRVDQNGNVLDPAGIAISTANGDQEYPAVTFGGSYYFVAWQDWRNGYWSDIYGARVAQSGAVIDTSGLIISNAHNCQWWPTIASDGTNYFVVWFDWRNYGTSVYGAIIDQSGTIVDTCRITIEADTLLYNIGAPAISFDGSNYLVAWHEGLIGYRNIYGRRVNPSGTILDTSKITISDGGNEQLNPVLTFSGTDYFAVWEDARNDPGTSTEIDIYGARITPAGILLDTAGIPISTALNYQLNPCVEHNGLNCFIAWQDGRQDPYYDIYGAKLDSAYTIVDTFFISSRPDCQKSPAVILGPVDEILVTYTGFIDSINTHPANTMRILGRFYSFTGVENEIVWYRKVESIHLYIYPNPTYRECNVRYILPQETELNISVYDVAGRIVKQITDECREAGVYDTKIDMAGLSQGVYFIRIKAGLNTETQKITLIN